MLRLSVNEWDMILDSENFKNKHILILSTQVFHNEVKNHRISWNLLLKRSLDWVCMSNFQFCTLSFGFLKLHIVNLNQCSNNSWTKAMELYLHLSLLMFIISSLP